MFAVCVKWTEDMNVGNTSETLWCRVVVVGLQTQNS